MLTPRDRFIRTLIGQDVDRVPFMPIFGGGGAVLPHWKKQYPGIEKYIDELLGFEGAGRGWAVPPINMRLAGTGEPITEFEDAQEAIIRTGDGTVTRVSKADGEFDYHIMEYPVKAPNDWDRIKSLYLDPHEKSRIPQNWPHYIEMYRNRDYPVQLTCAGVYGFLRLMMGDEALCYAFYDEPEMLLDITQTYIDMCIAVWEVLCRDVQFDIIECWEDMASKNGSIISPACFRQFLAPQYRKIRAFAEAHGIPILAVDSDGNINELAHEFAGCGVNVLYPFEAGAGCDPLATLRALPGLGAIGCLEKNCFVYGEDAIEREMEKARALIRQGRCIPGPDHGVIGNVSFESYKLFFNRLREVVFTTKPGT
ncbi:MAG: hypothetical protein FWD16_03690 [Clostridia bacterium]|nr:hypothetical protein [Clostridia bacterium]